MMKKRKLQNDILCSIQDMPAILKSWILLDSQSRVDMFSNPRLSNIQETKRTLKCYCTVL